MEQHSIIIYILFAIVMILTMPTPWQGVIVLLAGIIAAWFRLGLFHSRSHLLCHSLFICNLAVLLIAHYSPEAHDGSNAHER